ncbi:MAG: hypothetical protein JXX14_13195 [Deltaproteobacteria bacterium]|nr:hypothetical protein [Deltaproteobacteria bacterium]
MKRFTILAVMTMALGLALCPLARADIAEAPMGKIRTASALPTDTTAVQKTADSSDVAVADTGDAVVSDASVAAVGDVEEIETVDDVEVVEVVEVVNDPQVESGNPASTEQPTAPTQTALVTAGRLHPAFVHLPLGLLIALLLFEFFALNAPRDSWGVTRFGGVLWAVTLASFFPAIFSGMLRAREVMMLGGQLDASLHRNLMLASFAALGIAAGLRVWGKHRQRRSQQLLIIGLLAICALLAFSGAHQGGKLVYGADFLPF